MGGTVASTNSFPLFGPSVTYRTWMLREFKGAKLVKRFNRNLLFRNIIKPVKKKCLGGI